MQSAIHARVGLVGRLLVIMMTVRKIRPSGILQYLLMKRSVPIKHKCGVKYILYSLISMQLHAARMRTHPIRTAPSPVPTTQRHCYTTPNQGRAGSCLRSTSRPQIASSEHSGQLCCCALMALARLHLTQNLCH